MGLTRELLQGITSVRRAANRDPVRERVTPARLRGQEELQMKKLTLVCFLLSFCATSISRRTSSPKQLPDFGRKQVQRWIQRVPRKS